MRVLLVDFYRDSPILRRILNCVRGIFINTCLIRCVSPFTFSCLRFLTCIFKVCCLFLISGCIITTKSCKSSPTLNSSSKRINLPLSILDISRTSLIRLNNNLGAPLIFPYNLVFFHVHLHGLAIVAIPMMAFMGVRIS